ncbi:MAG: Ig-like domain repeat protein, partial [Methanobrevibacter sp.]|nr:Ig-like domain repeat protein [Methanobrevibacter sp.]
NGQPCQGQVIVLNVHGVFYNRTTDVNGSVFLDINLDPGEYIITAYYGYVNPNVFEYAISNKILIARP